MESMDKIINGSKKIKEALESGKKIDIKKAIRALLINDIIIAEELKRIKKKETSETFDKLFNWRK